MGYKRILNRMREKIRTRQYVMTLHAEEEMNEDGLTIYDVERGILTGEVQERQRDRVTGNGNTVLGVKQLREKESRLLQS